MNKKRDSSQQANMQRHDLYRMAIPRARRAVEEGYPLEAIALYESLMADRIENALHLSSGYNGRHLTIGTAASKAMKNEKLAEAHGSLAEAAEWAKARNQALHEMAKVTEGSESLWAQRMAEATSAAEQGYDLFRKLDRSLRKALASETA